MEVTPTARRPSPQKDRTFAPGTFGAVMGHAEVLAECESLHQWWADTDEQDAHDSAVGGALESMW